MKTEKEIRERICNEIKIEKTTDIDGNWIEGLYDIKFDSDKIKIISAGFDEITIKFKVGFER